MNSKDKILLEVDESFKKKLFLQLCGDENEKGILKTFEENEWCFRASEENVRSEIVDPIIKLLDGRFHIYEEKTITEIIYCVLKNTQERTRQELSLKQKNTENN